MVEQLAEDGFASWLRGRRDALFMTQESLAEEAGVAVRTIRYLEAGRTQPRPYTREVLVAAVSRVSARLSEVADGALAVPAQLPLGPPAFVGRGDALRQLDQLAGDARSGAAVGLILGAPGIGKTTLSVHWAHRARTMFPDGQLFMNLNGFSASGAPEDPDDVLLGFLEALGVSPERIPRRAAERIGLYRTVLAGRRVLVVLDNAVGVEQVRRLLPGSAGSMAVVTSRNEMPDLVSDDGAVRVPVAPCTYDESKSLLAARLGAPRVAAEPAAATEIVHLCAGLPLALGVVSAHAAARPSFPLASLVTGLRDTRAADLTGHVGAAMSWSCRSLSAPAGRLFRTLGLHPRPDVTAEAVAAFAGVEEPQARAALAELTAAHLAIEHRPGRYTMHDVVHDYARELAGTPDETFARDMVQDRIYAYYTEVVTRAVAVICPHHGLTDGRPETTYECDHAVQVLAAEQEVLYDVLRDASRAGAHEFAWQIAASLFIFLERLGRWRALLEVARLAVASAAKLDDPRKRLEALRLTARAHVRVMDRDAARAHFADALRLADALADPAAEGGVHFDLALFCEAEERYAESVHHFTEALERYRRLNDVAGEATALNAIGWGRVQLGEPAAALDDCRKALVLHGIVGNRHGEAATLDSLGFAHHRLGDGDKAIDAYRSALDLIPATGDRHLEAMVLDHLGDARESTGDFVRARADRERALTILDEISPPHARAMRLRLHLAATGSAPT